MAQFDVHPAPGRRSEEVPYVVVLRSARFDRAATRFVAPLVLRSGAPVRDHYISPGFQVEGQDVWLDVFNMASVPARALGKSVASLAGDGDRERLIRALDELISTA